MKRWFGGAPPDLQPIPDIYDEHPPDDKMLLPGMYFKPMALRQWLETSGMNLGGNAIKRRIVIKYMVNQYGGVHLEPKLDDEVHRVMARFQGNLRVEPDDPVQNDIYNITDALTTALPPPEHCRRCCHTAGTAPDTPLLHF